MHMVSERGIDYGHIIEETPSSDEWPKVKGEADGEYSAKPPFCPENGGTLITGELTLGNTPSILGLAWEVGMVELALPEGKALDQKSLVEPKTFIDAGSA